jgi:hypothetical protein
LASAKQTFADFPEVPVNKSKALLTEREAAAYLGRPAGTLRAWRHDSLGPRFKKHPPARQLADLASGERGSPGRSRARREDSVHEWPVSQLASGLVT